MKDTLNPLSAARGLSVLFMPSIHTVMMYSHPAVHHSWLGYLMRFFAEGVSSHLYMFLMGLFIVNGKPKRFWQIFVRAAILLLAGYGLNFFRIYLPAVFRCLPQDMLEHYGAAPGHLLPLLLTGDILQFAGIAYGLVAVLYKIKLPVVLIVTLYLLIAFIAPFTWGKRSENLIPDHLLALFCANDTRAFFPLLPWLCYPLAGMVAGKWLYQHNDKKVYPVMAMIGIISLIVGIYFLHITPGRWESDFYRDSAGGTIAHTGFVMMWIPVVYFGTRRFCGRYLQILLSFCSRHITSLYIIHWVIIGWGIGLAGYQRLTLTESLLAISIINLLSFSLVFLADQKQLRLLKHKIQKFKTVFV